MPVVIKRNLINEETVKLLKKFQILNELTCNEILLLLGKSKSGYQEKIARLLKYEKGEVVIQEGEYDSWIFWLVQGAFIVTNNNVVLAEFNEPGEVFGEMSSVDVDSRSATVITKEDGICVSIDMSVLDTIANKTIKAKLINGIQHLQSQRLINTNSLLVTERKKIFEQQEFLNEEKKRLKDKEELLTQWELKLLKQEKLFLDKLSNILPDTKTSDTSEN